MLNGIKNFLSLVNDNWTTIMVIIGLIVALYRKINAYLKKTNDEKIAAAKAQLKETILKFITDAEVDYDDWNKAGSVKRSQVIQAVYREYPVLSKVVDQAELIKMIDGLIDNALIDLRKIVAENKQG